MDEMGYVGKIERCCKGQSEWHKLGDLPREQRAAVAAAGYTANRRWPQGKIRAGDVLERADRGGRRRLYSRASRWADQRGMSFLPMSR
jgi:hypothetical protein